jgi:serine/threonine-protein kinase
MSEDNLRALASDPRIDLDGTIRDKSLPPTRPADTAGKRALAALSHITGDRLQLAETLGQGGMGIVHLGTQVALGRKVAVKTLRPEHRSEQTAVQLLREAWITGALEHPNVVPVYDLGLDPEGHPYIVLKRIEGARWADLMRDEAHVSKRFGQDLLEWNLSILLSVMSALSFAHSRGIVHCDLKPDNVMIGEFGEVYVLDWGIAVSLRDDGSGRLPLAHVKREVCGTPCYMAPEMITGAPLSARTDVYLLGGILFEIACGRPPHDGATVREVMSSALKSNPRFEDGVEPELVRICRRALNADPDARFENAQQLRLALQGFLQRRGSALLAREAEQRLQRLQEMLTAGGERVAVYNLFGECRFGFQQAVKSWRDNAAAHDGLLRATTAMIDYELAAGDPKAARLLAGSLPSLPPEVGRRIDAAQAEWEKAAAARKKLEELGSDWDPNVGRRTRLLLSSLAGILWTLTPLAFPLRPFYHTYLGMMTAPALLLLFTVAVGVWARDSMTKTAINRTLLFSTVLLMVAQIALHGGSWITRMPIAISQSLDLFVWFCFSGLLALTLDARLFIPSVGYLAGFLLACRWPAATFPIMSATNLLLTVTMVKLWGKGIVVRRR